MKTIIGRCSKMEDKQINWIELNGKTGSLYNVIPKLFQLCAEELQQKVTFFQIKKNWVFCFGKMVMWTQSAQMCWCACAQALSSSYQRWRQQNSETLIQFLEQDFTWHNDLYQDIIYGSNAIFVTLCSTQDIAKGERFCRVAYSIRVAYSRVSYSSV
jgi:hypothetical protein